MIDLKSDSKSLILDLIESKSELIPLQRLIARLQRIAFNCRQVKQNRRTGFLKPSELMEALILCVKIVQKSSFGETIKELTNGGKLANSSRLLKLHPFLDNNGILRVGGRLQHSTLCHDAKHPMIIPPDHHLTDLLIRNVHHSFYHAQTGFVLNELRTKFWILNGRSSVRRVINRCLTCKRFQSFPQLPLMGPLPPHRLKPNLPPFTFTGIDYFGHYFVKVNRSNSKRWVCLFTCLVTRAVHLEMTDKLDADSFLLAFRRFISRRGSPKVVYSDNGTNFVAGERELAEGIRNLNQSKIADYLSQKEIEWNFNPPSAPHFGGVWERLVRSCKTALRVVLTNVSVNDETFSTFLTEVESLLNGRPLTHVSVDPDDPEPLTPNHFILGRPNPNIPPDIVEDRDAVSRRRCKLTQSIVNQFWKRWMKEYVPGLTERKKWLQSKRNIQIDDIVLVVDQNSPRGSWPVGRVMKIFPGKDGVVRAVAVKTKHGEFVRPVVKLCLLDSTTEN